MPLTLSVFILAFSLGPQVAQPAPTPVPAESAARHPAGRLVIRLGLRTRSPSPANAALTFSRLLGDLRDSLGRSRTVDSALPMELRSLLPAPNGKEYDLSLTVTLGPEALPQFVQVLDHLASGPVRVTDLRFDTDGLVTGLAGRMLQAVADSTGPPSAGRTLGRLGQLALLVLAIRREVRQ
ncbi:MAG TPA: hypothetical protein VFI13_11945 [Gemmatimonadales bacterium]|nr:hypothetical protein [Gemmatimonadales bacterium]